MCSLYCLLFYQNELRQKFFSEKNITVDEGDSDDVSVASEDATEENVDEEKDDATNKGSQSQTKLSTKKTLVTLKMVQNWTKRLKVCSITDMTGKFMYVYLYLLNIMIFQVL